MRQPEKGFRSVYLIRCITHTRWSRDTELESNGCEDIFRIGRLERGGRPWSSLAVTHQFVRNVDKLGIGFGTKSDVRRCLPVSSHPNHFLCNLFLLFPFTLLAFAVLEAEPTVSERPLGLKDSLL